MKTKDNIHKVINLNAFVSDLLNYYEIVTYSEYSYNTYIEWYKVYTILYGDSDISLLIVNNKYRLYQEWNGYIVDCDTIEELENALNNAILELEQNV